MMSLQRRVRHRSTEEYRRQGGRYSERRCIRLEQSDFHERIGSLVHNAKAGTGSDIERFEPQR